MPSDGASVVRWTPRRIQKALLCPKPTGAIAKLRPTMPARRYAAALDPVDRRVLRWVAEHADLLDAPTPPWGGPHDHLGGGWLLVPVPAWLLKALAQFEADRDELEGDSDAEAGEETEGGDEHDGREPDVDAEPDHDGEPEDAEPNVARAVRFGGPTDHTTEIMTVRVWRAAE